MRRIPSRILASISILLSSHVGTIQVEGSLFSGSGLLGGVADSLQKLAEEVGVLPKDPNKGGQHFGGETIEEADEGNVKNVKLKVNKTKSSSGDKNVGAKNQKELNVRNVQGEQSQAQQSQECSPEDPNCKGNEVQKPVAVPDPITPTPIKESDETKTSDTASENTESTATVDEVPSTTYTSREEVEWLLDGTLNDVENSFAACASEDDTYDFPLLDRMSHQNRPVKSCLEKYSVVGHAYMAINLLEYLYGEASSVMLPYFSDLIIDLKLQIRDFHKQANSLYYWHGPKRAIPTQLRRLAEHWRRSTKNKPEYENIEVPSVASLGSKGMKSDSEYLKFDEKLGTTTVNGIPLVAFDLEDFRKLSHDTVEEMHDAFHKHVISSNYQDLSTAGLPGDKTFRTFVIDEKVYPSVKKFEEASENEELFKDMSAFNVVLIPLQWVKQGGVKGAVEWLKNRKEKSGDHEHATIFGVASPRKCLGKKQLEKIYSINKEVPDRFKVVYTRSDAVEKCEIGNALLARGLTPIFTSQYNPSFHTTAFQEYRTALESGFPIAINHLSTSSTNHLAYSLQKWLPLMTDKSKYDEFTSDNYQHLESKLFPIRRVLFPDVLSLLYVPGSSRKAFSPEKTADGFWKYPRSSSDENFDFPLKLIQEDYKTFTLANGEAKKDLTNQDKEKFEHGGKGYDNYRNSKFIPGINKIHMEKLPEYIKQFKENEDLVIAEDFFDKETFAKIEEEAARIWRTNSMEPNCNLDGKNRLGGYVLDDEDREGSFYELIYNNPGLAYWVSSVYGKRMWASDFPVELREYGPKSKGMQCHRDLQLFAEQHIDAEFAFTVSNNSPNHVVSFVDLAGKEHKINPKPNTLLMVRPNASYHCAGPMDPGTSRTMMKWIFSGTFRKQAQFHHYSTNNCGAKSRSAMGLFEKMEQVKAEDEQKSTATGGEAPESGEL